MWLSQYVFHHVLHDRNGPYGTFRLVLPKPLETLAGLWMGKRNVSIVCEHIAHHDWPQVRAGARHGSAPEGALGPAVVCHSQREASERCRRAPRAIAPRSANQETALIAAPQKNESRR